MAPRRPGRGGSRPASRRAPARRSGPRHAAPRRAPPPGPRAPAGSFHSPRAAGAHRGPGRTRARRSPHVAGALVGGRVLLASPPPEDPLEPAVVELDDDADAGDSPQHEL